MEQESQIAEAVVASANHQGTPFPPFDPANFSSLVVWLALTFAFLYLLFSKFVVPRVESILHARAHHISQNLSEAHALKAKAEEAAAAHEKLVADAKAKALALAQEAHARLNAESETKRAALEAELNSKLAVSEAQLATMKAQALGNVESIAKDAAEAIIVRITGKPADADAIAKAIATLQA
ncbi:MAG TPA: F0F1 ATP synthase subunit B' [Methylocella sp.]|nr:F0F1 ATP synthase subunit B' [Methylocella sp.]